MWDEVEKRFATEHGRLRGQEAAVLALGKLGGREMTAGSDLDLILIYDFDPKATMFILGTEMDYVEDKLQSGFVFRNPNEKGRCGCGESFHV